MFDAYRDPMFWWFPVASTVVGLVSFGLFAGILSWLAARDPVALRRYRIQTRPPRAQRLLRPSILAWLGNSALGFVLVVAAWPILRGSNIHAGALPAWYVIVGQVVLFVYLDDFLYYWMHRALHQPWLYKRVHSLHHRIVTPWAITGNYLHPIEYLLTINVMLVGPLLVGAHVVTLWIWIVVRQWEAAEGHAGYDLPWTPTHWFPSSDGARHHDWHHARVRGNYAGFFRWTDRVFGTYAPGYADDLAARGKR